jgi:predicted nucleotidyltransferase
MLDNKIQKKLLEIAKKNKVDLLILFGSRASNTNKKDSDWDFGYISWKGIDKFELWKDLERVCKNVDLINLNDSISFFLKKEIIDNSILIYEKYPGLYEDVLGEFFIEYMDNKKYLDEYLSYLEKELKM